jgi:hypothetical protein
MKFYVYLFCLIFTSPLICFTQDNYEIQVYASPTVGKDTTMVELHSNYSFIGMPAQKGIVSTNHMDRETIEITHGGSLGPINKFDPVPVQQSQGWDWLLKTSRCCGAGMGVSRRCIAWFNISFMGSLSSTWQVSSGRIQVDMEVSSLG